MKTSFYVVVATAMATGLLVPFFAYLSVASPYLMFLMLYANFLDVRIEPRRLVRAELVYALVVLYGVMPFLMHYVIAKPFAPEFRLGLLLITLAPIGNMSLIVSRFVRKTDYNLIFANYVVGTFTAVFYLPFMLKVLVGEELDVAWLSILGQVAVIVMVPYFLATATRKLVSDSVYETMRRHKRPPLMVLLFLLVAISMSKVPAQEIFRVELISVTLAVWSIFLIGGGLGALGGFFFRDDGAQEALTFGMASRNVILVLTLAIVNFPLLTRVPLVIALVMHHGTNALWLWLYRPKTPRVTSRG